MQNGKGGDSLRNKLFLPLIVTVVGGVIGGVILLFLEYGPFFDRPAGQPESAVRTTGTAPVGQATQGTSTPDASPQETIAITNNPSPTNLPLPAATPEPTRQVPTVVTTIASEPSATTQPPAPTPLPTHTIPPTPTPTPEMLSCSGTAASVLVDDNTTGYYNNALGTVLDDTQLQFPPADSYGSNEPTIPNAPEPNLASAASILGDWLTNPLQLNANWSALQAIPMSWSANIENAIIYPVSVGPQGFTRVVGNFGVDNGLFVWVNGRYKFGATAPGAVGGFEYTNVDLGSLPPGLNYIQILREDHSDFGGFTVLITCTVEAASGHITSPVENSTTGPVTLLFSADAWSNIGVGVNQVEFYVFYDRRWHAAGIDTSAPYEVIWQTQ